MDFSRREMAKNDDNDEYQKRHTILADLAVFVLERKKSYNILL